jgi:hypothetical protein
MRHVDLGEPARDGEPVIAYGCGVWMRQGSKDVSTAILMSSLVAMGGPH